MEAERKTCEKPLKLRASRSKEERKSLMSQPKEFMFYGYDGETVAECCDDEVKVEWAYIGEGYNGDYNPADPSDVELLRFYVYHIDDGEWVDVEDASYCTNMPLRTDQSTIEASLLALFDRFSDALGEWPYCSVKKLGEELSWISPAEF